MRTRVQFRPWVFGPWFYNCSITKTYDPNLRHSSLCIFSPLREFVWVYISNLAWGCRLQTQAPSGGREFVRRRCAFFVQREALVLFQQSLAFGAQVFVLVSNLHGGEVPLGCKHKATGQDQTTEQQQRQS